MDWVRNNKFLAGFLAFMVIGVGGLGYLLYSTQGRYDQVSQEYATQVTELKRLQHLDPYPDDANLKRFNDQKKAFGDAVTGLQTRLAGMTAPADKPLSPSDFQNRLREIVSDVTRAATQVGVGIPEKFYLGFEQYQASLPDAPAMPYLTTQLTEIEQIVRILINRKIDKIISIKRSPLPGETGAVVATPAPGEKPKASGPELVTRYPIEIGFSASPTAFRESLAQITEAPRLFVTRAIQVKNEVDKGPTRGQDAATPGGTARPGGSPAAAPAPGSPTDQALPEKGPPPLRYVVGQEKLEILMNIELLRVLLPR